MKLSLPDCNETKLFRQLVAKVKSDPTLSRVVKRWFVFQGDKDEDRQVQDRDYPYIALAATADGADTVTEGMSTSPMHIQIEAGVNGTNSDDIMNLWEAIRNAFFPGDGTVQTIMTANQATGLKLVRAPYTSVPAPGGGKMLLAKGMVSAEMWTQTRT
jgi:hypothetical protein